MARAFDLGHSGLLNKSLGDYELGLVSDAVSSIADGIRLCSERIQQAHKTGSDEYADAVTDEQCDVIETLLGCAFTVCQVRIAQIVSGVRSIHRHAARAKPQVVLATTTARKQDIMRYGGDFVGNSSVTRVEAIDALANYFKHRDEWPHNWDNLNRQAERTAQVLTAIGLSQGLSGNLRTGSEMLDNPDYVDTHKFVSALQRWQEGIVEGYKREIKMGDGPEP